MVSPRRGGEIRTNVRLKIYPDGEIGEVLACNRAIFVPNGWISESNKCSVGKLTVAATGGEIPGNSESDGRSAARSRKAVFDLARSNSFDYFVTWTVSPEARIDRYDYKACVRALGQYLDNEVRRRGLRYVAVPERHKDGAIHFHGLCKWEKPPRKVRATNAHTGAPLNTRAGSAIYNLPAWTHGFSTCIETYGGAHGAAIYMAKYVTKSQNMVGGRRYLSGGTLLRPTYKYIQIDESALSTARAKFVKNIHGTGIAFSWIAPEDWEKLLSCEIRDS